MPVRYSDFGYSTLATYNRRTLTDALRLLSCSFIPEMAVKEQKSDELAPYGLNHIYNAKLANARVYNTFICFNICCY